MFELLTPLSYWFLSALWLLILALYALKFRTSKLIGGTVAVLLTVLAIDAFRTSFESLYFGFYFNSQFGLLPPWIYDTLSQPHLLIIPKIVNIIAGILVLTLLIKRWIPRELQQHQEAEARLTLSQQQLQDIAANVPGVVYQFEQKPDGSRRYPYVSPRIHDLFGISAEQVMENANAWIGIVHPDDMEELDTSINVSANNLSTWDWYGRMIRQQNGDCRWVRGTSQPRKMDDGSILWNGVLVDITRDKHNDDQLRQSEKKFRSLFNDALDMIHIIDAEGRIVEANKIELEKMGYSRDEYIGKSLRDIIHPDYLKHGVQGAKRLFAGETLHDLETLLITRDGREIPVEVNATPMIENGEVVSARSILRDITERKKYLETLRQSEETLRASFNQAAAGIAHTDLDGKFLRVNQKLCDMTGYSESELTQRTFHDITHPDDNEKSISSIKSLLNGDVSTYNIEKRYLRKDGETIWVNLAVALSHHQDGSPKHFISIMTDITDRKETEQALAYSERELRVILDNIEDTFYRTNLEGAIVIASKSVQKLLGYKQEEMIGKQLSDFYANDEGREGFLKALSENNGSVIGYEVELCHRDGHPVWVSTNSHHAKDLDGNVIGVEGIARDITARKKTEEELYNYRLHLEDLVKERTEQIEQKAEIIDQAKNPIISADPNRIITSWNTGAENMFGYTTDEAIGKHIYFIHPESEHKNLVSQIKEPLEKFGEFEIDVELQKKNGELFNGHLSLSHSKDSQGNIKGFNVYIVDISDRKHAEQVLLHAKEQAEKANRAKSEFLSRMSHELRTPMNAILGFAQLLELQLPEQKYKASAHEIVHAGRHLLDLINEVLDLSHIESGQYKLTLSPVNLVDVIAESLSIISPLAEKRQLHISENITSKQEIKVYSDATRLRQAILNLLSNAVKYNREGGNIRVYQSGIDDSFIHISIEDTGQGLTEEQQTHLFQPFERLGAENSAIEGTGIGLMICQRLIEMMGGTISVKSTPGKGTTFTLAIKLYKQDQGGLSPEPQSSSVTLQPTPIENQFKILYIEDNPANLRLVEQILSLDDNIKLLSASRPQLGLELAAAHKPDLILLDINLPDMDGYEVISRLRGNPATQDIPVIAVTAFAMTEDTIKIEQAGFDHYLAKPLNVNVLMDTINQYANKDASLARSH